MAARVISSAKQVINFVKTIYNVALGLTPRGLTHSPREKEAWALQRPVIFGSSTTQQCLFTEVCRPQDKQSVPSSTPSVACPTDVYAAT